MAEFDDLSLVMDRKNPYARVAHIILEALALADLNRTQFHICHFIIRRTFGWNRNYDAISLSDFSAACGTSRQNISRQIAALVSKHIIRRLVHATGITTVYALVADPTQWDPRCIDLTALAANQLHGVFKCTPAGQIDLTAMHEEETYEDIDVGLADGPEDMMPEPEGSYDDMTFNQGGLFGNDGLQSYHGMTEGSYDDMTFNQPSAPEEPDIAPTLKTVLKKDKERKKYCLDSIEFQLSQLLLLKIRENLPRYKMPDLQKWSTIMDYIIRLDEHPPDEVREVILFSQADPFWCANILSPRNLRDKYDNLNLKRINKNKASPYKPKPTGAKEAQSDDDHEYDFFFK